MRGPACTVTSVMKKSFEVHDSHASKPVPAFFFVLSPGNLIAFLFATVAFLLCGCGSTTRTITSRDGRMVMTEERGGRQIGAWELKQVTSVAERNALARNGWTREGIVHQENGPDLFLMKRKLDLQAASAAKSAPPPFRPLLITTLGTNSSSDGTWEIGVTEKEVGFSRLEVLHPAEGLTFSNKTTLGIPAAAGQTSGWKTGPGWFVFIENESRVWAYNGVRELFLETYTSHGTDSSGSASYCNHFPCAIPDEVFSRLSPQAREAIQKND